MPKAKLDSAYEILLDYGYIEPGVSDRVYWEALKQATLDFQEEGNVEYFDIVRAEEKELRDKVIPKIKKTKISAEAFKKGTSQDIKPNTEVTSLAIREPRPDVTSKDITPETLEEETVVEPKQPSIGEGFKNILNSIAGSTESIKNLLLGQQQADKQAAKDVRKSREDSKRKVKEKKIESRVFDGLKKVGEKVVSPVKGLLGQIWDFIKTLILSAVVGKLIKWFQNPKNKKKVKSVFRFIKDWWPALLAGWLLFGTGIGSLITGTVAAIAGFIPVLTGLLVPLAAFAASPIGLAVLATGGIAAFLATQKNKTDQAVDESVATQGKDKTVSDLREEDANKNIFQKAGGFITGETQERKEQIQRVETGTEKRYGFFGELPEPAKFNKGGSVPGSGNTDTVPAMLTPGEFVLTKEATEKYGTDTLEGMNAAAATGKKETSGTGRIIGSTLGGFTGGVVGFFADSPVSPVADIALGLAGSAAGGEIGDNVERKVRGMKKGGKVVEDDGLGYGIKGDTRTFLPGKIDPNNKSAGAGEMVVPEGASAITGKEKEKIEAETLHWVNKERAFMGIEPPLKKITYSQGVYLAKAKGPGPRTKEHTSTTDDWENMTRTSSTTKWIEGKGTTMSSSMRRLSPEEREQYLANNPYARIAASIKNQSELDNLGADISASAKKSAGYNKGGLVQHFNKGGLVQHFNKGGLVQEYKKLYMESRRIKPGPNGKWSKEDRKRKGQLAIRMKEINKQIENYDNTSGEKRRSIPKKSEKNPANFLQPQGFQSKKGESKKGGGLGRLIGGAADMLTGNLFDFDNKSGGGLIRKVVGGTADALTGNRWDFDNQGKPEVKSEPPKISGKLKPADITPPVVGGAAGQPNITTMNLNESGVPIPIGGDDQPAPDLPDFSPIAMRSRDKIKTLGIMV